MSTGSSEAAKAWQAKQKALVQAGRIEEAMQMDIDDIRAQFGTKYDDQIKEMMESLEQNKSFQAYKTRISGGSGC